MKKFSLTFGADTREVNANEYSIYPKTGGFSIPFGDSTLNAWTTYGRGKSLLPNYYLYWAETVAEKQTLYWTKISADEFASAKGAARLDPVGEDVAPQVVDTVETFPTEAEERERVTAEFAAAEERERVMAESEEVVASPVAPKARRSRRAS